jgi:hypothetical protein
MVLLVLLLKAMLVRVGEVMGREKEREGEGRCR